MRWLLVSVGWGVSVELIGSVVSPTLLPLSIVAEVVTLVIGVTGTIVSIQLVEGVKRMRVGFSFKVPWLCFSLQLKMRR